MKTQGAQIVTVTNGFERLVHWSLALSCIVLFLTGLAMMFHTLNALSMLTGGMYNLKQIHNYSGIVFAVSLFIAIPMWWAEAGRFEEGDRQWISALGGYIGHSKHVPEAGKYNAGQKLFFLAVVVFGLCMVVSGTVMWLQAKFDLSLVRWMYALHALGFTVIFAFFFVHLYLATIGVPGSASAMLTGKTTYAWLKTNHGKWLKELEKTGLIKTNTKK
ncbi:MAG: formate dehydrogenase subunit gamma [Deltaproteobacteria bacterium]|nr:formate dehydrogenase subunit gamma [Deltaproteobacteria bacterium]